MENTQQNIRETMMLTVVNSEGTVILSKKASIYKRKSGKHFAFYDNGYHEVDRIEDTAPLKMAVLRWEEGKTSKFALFQSRTKKMISIFTMKDGLAELKSERMLTVYTKADGTEWAYGGGSYRIVQKSNPSMPGTNFIVI